LCRYSHYQIRDGTTDCYAHPLKPFTYFQSEKECRREGGHLVVINDRAENDFLKQFIDQGNENGTSGEFWIGLTDLQDEGTFRWVNNELLQTLYKNWAVGEPDNKPAQDCVVFVLNGWRMPASGCSATYTYVCEQTACETVDGMHCVGEEPTILTSSDNTAGIVVAVLIPIMLITVVCGMFWYLRKYKNDVWSKYICYLCHLRSKDSVAALEKENQRLRHELSLRRTVSDISKDFGRNNSLSGARFLPPHSPEPMPAIPDGQGGMLPSIKARRELPTGNPPPPALQRQTSSRLANSRAGIPAPAESRAYNHDQYMKPNNPPLQSVQAPSPPFVIPKSPPPMGKISIPASFASALVKNQAAGDEN
jgi:hypothetical protein